MHLTGRAESAVPPVPSQASQDRAAFERFVEEAGPRLGRALASVYGFEDGREATAEALAYAWENWQPLQHIENLPGYLFRVGQSRGRPRRQRVLFEIGAEAEHRFEPGLPKALAALSQRQRLAVVLVHGYGCTPREVAELTSLWGEHDDLPAAADGLGSGRVIPAKLVLPATQQANLAHLRVPIPRSYPRSG